jgi:hypothetical protein
MFRRGTFLPIKIIPTRQKQLNHGLSLPDPSLLHNTRVQWIEPLK